MIVVLIMLVITCPLFMAATFLWIPFNPKIEAESGRYLMTLLPLIAVYSAVFVGWAWFWLETIPYRVTAWRRFRRRYFGWRPHDWKFMQLLTTKPDYADIVWEHRDQVHHRRYRYWPFSNPEGSSK